MTPPYQCPHCKETDALRGDRDGDAITVTCLSCGERWARGAPRCRTCAGVDVVTALQAMSRHPRGNQLAIVGRREILLCRRCDAEVVADWVGRNRPVPEGYVSKALLDVTATPPSDPTQSRTSPSAPKRSASTAGAPAPRPRTRPAPAAAVPGSAGPGDPTVRQAMAAFLDQAGVTADSTAMLMLGTHLGASTRMSDLSRPQTAGELASWFEKLWPGQGDRQRAARSTVVAAFDYWREREWLDTDPAAQLRGSGSG